MCIRDSYRCTFVKGLTEFIKCCGYSLLSIIFHNVWQSPLSNAFSRSTKVICISWLYSCIFSIICHNTNNASTVDQSFLKSRCSSRSNAFATFVTTLNLWLRLLASVSYTHLLKKMQYLVVSLFWRFQTIISNVWKDIRK